MFHATGDFQLKSLKALGQCLVPILPWYVCPLSKPPWKPLLLLVLRLQALVELGGQGHPIHEANWNTRLRPQICRRCPPLPLLASTGRGRGWHSTCYGSGQHLTHCPRCQKFLGQPWYESSLSAWPADLQSLLLQIWRGGETGPSHEKGASSLQGPAPGSIPLPIRPHKSHICGVTGALQNWF